MNIRNDEKILKIAQSAYTTLAGIENTYKCSVELLEGEIEGDFVECGVAAGAQLGVMGYVMQKLGKQRRIWGYDSFQGIPMASENDDAQPGVGWFDKPKAFVEDKETLLVSSGITVHPKDSTLLNLKNWGLDPSNYNLIEGWFQHTLPIEANKPKKIAMLRLDGDMYESTKVCLEQLFPLVSAGGCIIIDDYALNGCKKACDEYLKSKKITEIYKIGEGAENYGSVFFFKKA